MPHAASGPLPPLPAVDRETWPATRRQIVEQLASTVYGRTPEGGRLVACEPLGEWPVPDGRAGQWRLVVAGPRGTRDLGLLVHRPMGNGPVPVILGLNFQGNQSTTHDERVEISAGQLLEPVTAGQQETAELLGYHDRPAAERGSQAERWPYARVLQRGWAVATVHCAEVEPDGHGYADVGVRGLFDPDAQAPWGTIGAWAWGLSRALDALSQLPGLDPARVAVFGHSRLGKTALWAAAQDERFAACVSVQSGCGGAALSRGKVGEHVDRITRVFPHWFTPGFATYGGREPELPLDQHHLLAAIAPRPLHVSSAVEDLWADPHSEYLSTLEASAAYEALGGHGTSSGWTSGGDPLAAPVPDVPISTVVGDRLSYHVRPGVHSVTDEDWDLTLDALGDLLGGG